MTISFILPGAPRTKKNSAILVRGRSSAILVRGRSGGKGRPLLLPSAAYSRWAKEAKRSLPDIRQQYRDLLPISTPCSIKALLYRDADRGDAAGYYQALGDFLQDGGVLENDRLIEDWDGSRLLVDRKQPRIEVAIFIWGTFGVVPSAAGRTSHAE